MTKKYWLPTLISALLTGCLLGVDVECDNDADQDGYPACERYAKNIVDCDDNNPDAHPSGLELCEDEVDNDCDGLLDFEDDCAMEIATDAHTEDTALP